MQRRDGKQQWLWIACLVAWPLPALATGAQLTCLTEGPGNDTEAAWSPDGRQIVFQSDRDGSTGLYLLDVKSKTVRRLLEGPGQAAMPAWSPDGRWIVYTYAHFTKTAFEKQADGFNLFVVPAGGGKPKQLTRGRSRDYSPVFLSDSQTIWFSSDRGNTDRANAVGLYAVSLAGEAPREVLHREGTDRAAVQATFSPDGKHLAFGRLAGFRDNWQLRLACANAPDDGVALTDARGSFYGPRWRPKGDYLAATGYACGDPGWGVWIIDARIASRVRLAADPGNSRNPAWSPDGSRLVLENNRTGAYKLYLADAPPMPSPLAAGPSAAETATVLRYDFAGQSTAAVPDLSAKHNDGKVLGKPEWQQHGVRFNTPGASITAASPKGLDFGAGPFAVKAVVSVTADCKFSMIAMGEYPGNRLGWQLYLTDDRRAQFNSRNTELAYRGARSDAPLPVDRPVALVGVRDATGKVMLFVDGTLQQNSSSDALYAYGAATQVRIGSQWNGSATFAGLMHEVEVLSRSISADELRDEALARFWALSQKAR